MYHIAGSRIEFYEGQKRSVISPIPRGNLMPTAIENLFQPLTIEQTLEASKPILEHEISDVPQLAGTGQVQVPAHVEPSSACSIVRF